ncbi:HlyD family efflux transporter periplasmic adaptor subunit [Croceicoccus ponticola]|uniref:HlyD family efflux transporter periplasmic adaptor subunit n=1 Tax=Croceicoccus ponticola TaxID=2217664 RepID=A0A437H2J6_9SPHN|nr:HlyD family efflux transporter periplasmic adaptor subunit [Croceicoccus ponticola]
MWARIVRWRWALLVTVLVGAGLAFAFWPEAVRVDEAEVTRGPMQVGITDDGVTRVHDLYTVSAPVTGYVTRIELDAGDPVFANRTVLARMAGAPSTPLDTRTRGELGDALNAARAAERATVAALDLARGDLSRAEELARRGFLPKAQLDATRAAARTAEADVQRARAESRRLQSAMAEPAATGLPHGGAVAVRSPVSGVVLRRLNESEGVVALGTPLMEIGNPAQIEVVVDLLSREAVQVKPGAAVEITRWGGPNPLPGKVRIVEPFGRLKISALGIEEQRVNVIVDFAPEAAAAIASLGHGYQVDGTIILWRDEDVVRVPVGALFRGETGGWQVLIDADGRARVRDVVIGHLNEQFGEVLNGLSPGDRVVLNPGRIVDDGTRIRRR